jgi:hypothetical protein
MTAHRGELLGAGVVTAGALLEARQRTGRISVPDPAGNTAANV